MIVVVVVVVVIIVLTVVAASVVEAVGEASATVVATAVAAAPAAVPIDVRLVGKASAPVLPMVSVVSMIVFTDVVLEPVPLVFYLWRIRAQLRPVVIRSG